MAQAKPRLEEIPIPDISHLVIEDDIPVNNFQSEKQQRCLVDPLYSSNVLPKPFLVAANVGIFNAITAEGIAFKGRFFRLDQFFGF